jgi:hypothetical protein
MNHKITLTCAPPGSGTWRVRVDDKDVITFAGPHAHELAEQTRREVEYFLESEVSDLHDTPKHE